MGVYLMFCFILLLCLKQAALQEESSCKETCGDIYIPSPFGIKPGCYKNSWFRVTCKKTANGRKPFISRINMELFNGYLMKDRHVTVINPVTYLHCDNKGNNGTIATASVNLELEGSPFFFSSADNVFGSVGCGNLVTVSGNNQTDPINGCLQQRCSHVPTSKLGTCYATIPGNLTSYTATLTEIKEYSKRSCTSVFVVDYSWVQDISIDTTYVLATLQWDEPVKCDLEAPLCKKLEPVPNDFKSGCIERCGNVDITYPFGINQGCYINEWFRVTCNETTDGPKPFISSINMQLLNVSFPEGRVIVNNPITYSNCLNKDEDNNGVSVNLTRSPFFFSDIFNRFASSGCGNMATIGHNPTDYPIVGCLQPSCGNTTTSNVSCITKIPWGLSYFTANMIEIDPRNGSNRSCGSAFIVDISNLLDSGGIIIPDSNGTSSWSWEHIPATLQGVTPKVGHVPTALQWGEPKGGECELKDASSTFYSSDGQYCWTRLSTQHLCVCTSDSNSDGYYSSVCKENDGKCRDLKYKYCRMLCLNAPGNYCSSSSCPDGYEYERDWCKPVDRLIPSLFLREKSNMFRNLTIMIGCGTSFGTLFLQLGTWHMYKVLKRRKNIKLKQKYFKRNGGLLLQQQLSCNEGNVEKIKLFASKELEQATDFYNENRILGQGGQGTVYKGILTDGSIVAVKKSKMIKEIELDQKKIEQFINEVILLSKINHRNVVKLLGCCLETKVPLLVYEFIPNGTLYQLLQDQNEDFPLTWEMRLRIATETANALSYLHSAASAPIYHRDIKSSNILLDDKYRTKVSDFGTSKSVALDQTHLTTQVQGTFGYMDPEYFRSSQFTEKSDVYSFAVVLVELLTAQKPISSTQSEEGARSLVSIFLSAMKENSLFDILDLMVKNDGPEDEIVAVAKLAKRCLNLNGTKRPTMKLVAVELEWIRASEEVTAVQQSDDEDSDIDEEIEIGPSVTATCSNFSSNSIINDSSGSWQKKNDSSETLPILDDYS